MLRKYLFIMTAVVSLISITMQSHANEISLAIFNFRAANIEALMYNSEILYSLISDLEKEKSIKLIPRRQMEGILSQNNLAQSDHPEVVIKAGQALEADFILFGNVAKQDKILVKLKLMDIANRRAVKTWNLRLADLQTISERTPDIAGQITAAVSISGAKEPTPHSDSASAATNDQTRGSAAPSQPELSSISKQGPAERLPYPPLVLSSVGGVRATEIKFVPALQNIKADIAIVNYKIYRHDPAIDEWTLIQTVNARSSSKSVFTIKDTHAMKDGVTYHYALTSVDKQDHESPRSERITVQTAPSSHKDIADNSPINDIGEQQTLKDAPALDSETDYDDLADISEHQTSQDMPALDSAMAKQDLADASSSNDITALPGTPVLNVASDNQLRQIDLVWRAQANTDGYHLYRKSQETDWHKIATITDAEQCYYTDTANLDDGQTYYYYLIAYNSGEETESSEQVAARTKELPPCPQEISASWRPNKGVKITWKPFNDSDVGGYIIYRGSIAYKSKKSVSVQEIAQVKGWQTDTYIDQEILSPSSGHQNYYAIKSFNLFNASGALSEAVPVKPEP